LSPPSNALGGERTRSKFDAYYRHRYSAFDRDVAIVIAIAIAIGTGKSKIPTAVTIEIAVETAVEIKTTEVVTPDDIIATGDGIKVRVDQFDGFTNDVFHCFAPRCYSAFDLDVAIAIAIAIAVGTQNGNIATEVTVAVAVDTAVAVKAKEVVTPDDIIATGDGIKVRVDHFDGFAYDVFHCLSTPFVNYKYTRREPLGQLASPL
jgi:tetrahydromethanopterin S-methyltransferase subunit B